MSSIELKKNSVIVNFAIKPQNVKPLLVSVAFGILLFALISE